LGGHAADGLPDIIIADVAIDDLLALLEALRLQEGAKLTHARGVRGEQRQWLHMAQENARAGAQTRISGRQAAKLKMQKVAELLGLSVAPVRIECFDISHSQGEAAYASCVVYGEEGLDKKRYRRFSVKDVTAGDDYAALDNAVTRHLVRLKEQDDLPGLLLIDGGKGQINRISKVLESLAIINLPVFGISKGATRKSGWEYLWEAGAERPIMPNAHDEGFRLLQHVRDEAHRFAITGHRKERAKSRGQSEIESLPGIGPKRRKELLLHFGSLKNMQGAPKEELERVPGISKTLAGQIFARLHGEE
jgi:excinuclease ABC subunit C